MKLPSTGMPHCSDDCSMELVKPVYGLADAPTKWFDILSKALAGLVKSSSWMFACCIIAANDEQKVRWLCMSMT